MSDSETDKNPFGEEEASTDEKKGHNSPKVPEKLQEEEPTKEKEEEQPPPDQAAKSSTPTTPSLSDANATTASFTSVDLTDDDDGKTASKTGSSEGEPPSNRGRTIPTSISNMAASQEQLARAATAIYKTPQRLASSLSDLGEKGNLIIIVIFVSQQQCESTCSLDALFS